MIEVMSIKEVIAAVTNIGADAGAVAAALDAHVKAEGNPTKRGQYHRLAVAVRELDLQVREGIDRFTKVTANAVI
jgi:hypothetical protein